MNFRYCLKRLLYCLGTILFFVLFACEPAPAQTGYGKAQYDLSQSGKFMKTWLVAGPFAVSPGKVDPDNTQQQSVFKNDFISDIKVAAGKQVPPVSVDKQEYKWQIVSSADDIVDLDSFYHRKDFAYAYALAEIKADVPANVMLSIGSDDGVKVWHNGKLVHDNWTPRAIQKDNDLVPLKLVKGSNQILLKIQDMAGGWGFVARTLDKSAMADQLNAAVKTGNLEKIKLLTDGGADINAANQAGITPIVVAKIAGRDDIVQLLLQKGAKDQNIPSQEILTDNFYNVLKGKEASGIAVLVAQDGKVLYKKGFGYADVKNKVLVSPDTKFRIGSVTKQFTAAAILKLQENNLLSVNDKLSKFIPDFPRGDEVTIHHLLTHTSGIHSYTSKDNFVSQVTKTITPDSLVSLIKKDPYDFGPGERMLYNNSGYFLLGYIISKVSGKSYEAYLKETFFDPLAMKNTGVHYAGIKLENEAKGYSRSGNKYSEALNWDMSWAGAAGAMYSTVDDLLKWNDALYNGKILNQKSFEAAITPAVLKNAEEPSMQYGYGLGLGKFRGKKTIGHSGGLHGFITQLSYFPEEKLTVVMFSNSAEPEVNFDPNQIAEIFLWEKLEKQKSYTEAAIKPADLKVYTGRYDLLGNAVIMVTTEDNKLYAQLTGQPKFEIFPSATDEFFWKVVEARIKFFRDEKGAISHGVLYQNGQELKAKKLPDEVIIEINPAILDQYVGKFRLDENTVVTLSRENNKLYAHPTGQQKVEMLPVSETDFVIREINAKVTFLKDASGKVNKFKLNMRGSDRELPRVE